MAVVCSRATWASSAAAWTDDYLIAEIVRSWTNGLPDRTTMSGGDRTTSYHRHDWGQFRASCLHEARKRGLKLPLGIEKKLAKYGIRPLGT